MQRDGIVPKFHVTLAERRNFQKIVESQGIIRDFKVHFKAKNGERVTVLLNGQAVRDEKGAIIGYEGSNVDISERMDPAGRILYAVYTEYLPFYHDNEKVLMDTILTYDPEPPHKTRPDIPAALEKIILKCLRKDPQARFSDAGALKNALLDNFPDFGQKKRASGRIIPATRDDLRSSAVDPT